MDTQYILPEDKKKYVEFLEHHFIGLASSRPRFPTLYHYTSGENLIKIVQGGELWTTQIACMNDAKEMLHAVDTLAKAISEREKQSPDKDFARLLEKMRELLTDPQPEVTGVFVACFSEREDDLSQWRAYGGPDGGYAIAFDPGKLMAAVAEQNGYLAPVTYDDDAKNILMTDILKWSENFFNQGIADKRAPSLEEWVNEFAVYWLDQLSLLAPLLKHPAFKDEQEWRLIYFLRDEDVVNMRFTERSSMMRRHLPLRLSIPDDNNYTPLPLSGVTVGPKPFQKLTKIAIGDLLKSKGYASNQVPVTLSAIPFRTAR